MTIDEVLKLLRHEALRWKRNSDGYEVPAGEVLADDRERRQFEQAALTVESEASAHAATIARAEQLQRALDEGKAVIAGMEHVIDKQAKRLLELDAAERNFSDAGEALRDHLREEAEKRGA